MSRRPGRAGRVSRCLGPAVGDPLTPSPHLRGRDLGPKLLGGSACPLSLLGQLGSLSDPGEEFLDISLLPGLALPLLLLQVHGLTFLSYLSHSPHSASCSVTLISLLPPFSLLFPPPHLFH